MQNIASLQLEVDSIDDSIVVLLGERFVRSREIGRIKLRDTHPPVDPERVRTQREAFVRKCAAVGVDTCMAERLITLIVDQVVEERYAQHNERTV